MIKLDSAILRDDIDIRGRLVLSDLHNDSRMYALVPLRYLELVLNG
jgi:hypothetical protein